MPLSDELKSQMEGCAAGAGAPEPPKPAEPEEPKPAEIPMPAEPPKPHTEPEKAEEPAPEAAPGPEQWAVLRAMESRLQELDAGVQELKGLVSAGKTPDYSPIFARIDSARAGIERLIPAQKQTPEPAEKAVPPELAALIQSILDRQDRNDRQLAQALRENANFQVQVRQGMQKDLDTLKEQLAGEQYDDLLKEVASAYAEYQFLLKDENMPERSRKNLQALFDQLEELLEEYGAAVSRSEEGSVRQTRTTKIIEKVPTGQKEKHNTVAKSRKPGVVRDRVVLCPEYVDVFVYDPALEAAEAAQTEQTAAETEQPGAAQAAPAEEAPAEAAEAAQTEAKAAETAQAAGKDEKADTAETAEPAEDTTDNQA